MVNKNYFAKKACISYFEILTLVVASFAFSFIIYEGDKSLGAGNNKNTDLISGNTLSEDKGLNSYVLGELNNIVISLFKTIINKISAPLIPLVSAESTVCCEQSKNGLTCFEGITASCNSNFRIASSTCEKTSFCKLGCCVDEVEGTYDRNVPQLTCKNLNKTWKDDVNCNFADASFGCCVLGKTTQFVTSQRCTRLAQQLGIKKDWRANTNELQCVALSSIKVLGACVSSVGNERTCKMMTSVECKALTGNDKNWNNGLLCTAAELNTTCKRTRMTSCFSGSDEVYFIDSCGNQANIYDASKVNDNSYWTSVLSKNYSCSPNSPIGNADSKTCGNCNRFSGGICSFVNISGNKPTYGNYYCKSTSCTFKNAAGVTREYKNGESWCDFDNKIGNGLDLPGSRHFKYVCSQGEVQVEPCADARNEICIEQGLKVSAEKIKSGNQTNLTLNIEPSDGEGFSNAVCRINNWRECISSDKGAKASSLDCMLASVKYDTFEATLAVPKYPEGFEVGTNSGEDICAKASAQCTVNFKATKGGDCKCVENCECLEGTFKDDMGEICKKLGDCGSKTNYLSGKPVDGQKVDLGTPEQLEKFLVAAGIIPGDGMPSKYKDKPMNAGLTWALGGGAIGVGGVMAGAVALWGGTAAYTTSATTGFILYAGTTLTSLAAVTAFAGFAILGAGIGYILGSYLAPLFGIKDPTGQLLFSLGVAAAGAAVGLAGSMYATGVLGSSFTALGGAVGGAGLGGTATGSFMGSSFALSAGLAGTLAFTVIALAVAAIVLIVLSFMFKGGKNKTCAPQTVSFTCSQWRPPAGGKDCEKCNGNPMKPCSEYRCKSLGASCNLINKGTSNEICINGARNDTSMPKIETGNAFSSSNAKISSITDKGFKITGTNKTCLDAYDYVAFGFTTSKPSQCRYDLQPNNFENMTLDFGTNNYVLNHTMAVSLPDPNAILNSYFENDETTIKSLTNDTIPILNANGNINFYIRCKDYTGLETAEYVASSCVDPGQDYNVPKILAALPPNNGSIRWNATRQEFAVFTNEPSECKWSFADQDYMTMETTMNCVNTIGGASLLGYQCDATLPVNTTTTTIYVRCKDQPWLGDSGDRNVNTQSFSYSLTRLSTQLKIVSIEPNSTIQTGTAASTINLKIKTSDGAPNPVCSYSFLGYDNMIQFYNTYSDIHEQPLNLLGGVYNLFIECVDSTGDKVRAQSIFTIEYDTTSPEVTRVLQQGGKVIIGTDEQAECRYSKESCNFNFIDGEEMIASTNGKTHSKNSDNLMYYVKCKDRFGNLPDSDSCSIIFHAKE